MPRKVKFVPVEREVIQQIKAGDITIEVVDGDFSCPLCGAPELSKEMEELPNGARFPKFNVKFFKVHDGVMWWGKCFVCRRWFSENGHQGEAF